MAASCQILVVEDDAGIRETITEILQLEGYGVAAACDGLDGLRQLAERRPDLLVVDLYMPGLDGAELIQRLRADASLRDLPVLLMTGATLRPGDAAPAADAVLLKPFELNQLVEAVRRLQRRG